MAGTGDFLKALFYDMPANGLKETRNFLSGNPDEIKQAYDQMMQTGQQMTQQTRQFLAGQEGKALNYYQPLQHMFNAAYGTEGLQPAQTPGVPGSTPLSAMYGAK